ncbi:GGDEF domain-containing protein [Enterovirga rhinocerotis]|uniref:diguanylate cyclase n=1 Tax=Enterovirga rhinocerotis TaxID=1339210 RepID=A0A4R7C4G9_9HYPH|nr:GGDEF domain-containing protein [Enterovirga rhinocerotis]TDR93268.1 diguanylate cyclase [Enterovirga rhinocerotis]
MKRVDRTIAIGERAWELMRAYARGASPQSYELWYTYVTGLRPRLNEAVKSHLSENLFLAADDIDRLYAAHIGTMALSEETDKVGSRLLMEMGRVINLIEAAAGSTSEYGVSLEAIQSNLQPGLEKTQMKEIVETLIGATRAVAASNQELEQRLKISRGEVESLHKVLEEVRTESLTDALTGLANRKHFEMTLAANVAHASAERAPLILTVIDIDHFKRFNDTYGHLTGDQVLRLVGAAMREHVTVGATLARFGGEEFAMLAPGIGPGEAFACAEKIRRNVMGRELLKRSTGESLGRVTISLGLAELRPGDTATTLLERADSCMYRAKQAGRNASFADWDLDEPPLASAA